MSATFQSEPAGVALDRDVYLRLESTQLCVDCDALFRVSRNECPSCGSGSALPIGKVLDAEGNRELVEALRALSKMITWAKRPTRPRLAREVEAPKTDGAT